jgi:hypothetical protein
MRCPHCAVEVNESWEALYNTTRDFRGDPRSDLEDVIGSTNVQGLDTPIKAQISFIWMYCPNKACGHLIVKGLCTRRTYYGGIPQETRLAEWFVLPRGTTRYVDPIVPREYADDYHEAAAILNDSLKMSATLSRRILAELLKDFGGYNQHRLSSRIEAFTKDTSNPKGIRDNLDYLREIGDFGAHTQKDDVTGSIIEVELEEAEWCLEIIDSLFEYYIVGPKRDAERRSSFDEKLARANRKPINPSE